MPKSSEFTVKFIDAFKIEKPSKDDFKVWNENFKDSVDKDKQVLRIVMRATHSALINRNKRFYIPSRMRDGVDTFINGNKPAKVLLNHDSYKPPVGIVRGAKYIDDIPEDLVDNKDVLTLLSSKASVVEQMDAYKSLMKDGIVGRPGWEGLGYVELTADIMDKETIEMVLDGRYDAVSTYFDSPGNAYCFICYKNWATADKLPACEHMPGKKYEDENEDEWPAMIIPTLHMNQEVSFVLKDADPLTSISITDSVNDLSYVEKNDDSWRENLETFNSKYEFKDKFEEDKNMAGKKKDKPIELSDDAKAVLEVIKKQDSKLDEAELAKFADQIAKTKVDGKYPNQDEADIDEETAVIYAFDSLAVEGEVNADEVYTEMEKEFGDEMKDKVLSKEDLKKLSKSTFCGPDRSFPVPDAAHAVAAKAVVKNYKGPGNKSEILASINKKAKAFGDESIKDSKEDKEELKFEMPSSESISVATDAEVLALYNKAEAICLKRQLKVDRPCAKCADAETEMKKAQDSLKEIELKIADSENVIKILRDELRFQAVDYASQVDACVALEEKIKDIKAEKLAIVGTLSGKYESLDSAKDSLLKENIDSIETSIMDSFDLKGTMSKLNNGMEHVLNSGQEPLPNPAEPNVETKVSDKKLDSTGKAALETFKDFIKSDKIEDAKGYFARMQHYGIFPDSFKFEELMAESKTNTSADK